MPLGTARTGFCRSRKSGAAAMHKRLPDVLRAAHPCGLAARVWGTLPTRLFGRSKWGSGLQEEVHGLADNISTMIHVARLPLQDDCSGGGTQFENTVSVSQALKDYFC